MDKLSTFILWGAIIFLSFMAYYLWPTKSRMAEFCADEKYEKNLIVSLKKFDLKYKILKTYEYESYFKQCEKELYQSPRTFKVKYRLETIRDRTKKLDGMWSNK